MALFTLLLSAGGLALLLYILLDWLRPYSIPPGRGRRLPGPLGVPLLGYLPFMRGGYPYEVIAKLGDKYGDVFQLRIGIRTVVVLDSYEAWRQAYSKDAAFLGRPELPSFRTFAESGRSRFAFRSGTSTWRFLRKTTVRALTIFSTSRNSRLDAIVDTDAQDLVENIQANAGKPYNPHRAIFNCVATVIGSINFGGHFNADHPLLKNVITLTERIGQFIALGSALDFLPFGSIIRREQIRKFLVAIEPVDKLSEQYIAEVRVDDVKDNDQVPARRPCTMPCQMVWEWHQVRTVADALYRAAIETPEHEKRALGLNDDHIRFISSDLFGAGFGTTMETLRWAVNYLAVYTDVQSKAQLELDHVLKGEPVSLKHTNMLPYLTGVLLETFRVSSLVPFSLPHWTMTETTLYGFYIPPGAIVLANAFKHHRNESYFPDAHLFKPDRFIKDGGQTDIELASHVVPFGLGKRRCVGENVSRQELFILIGRLLQKYECWIPYLLE